MTPTYINPLLYCMHYVTCVKCIQEILVFHSSLSFKAVSCHGAGSVITGGTVVWHNDNFRCRHWWWDWHCGSSGFSVFVHLFKRLFMFMFKPNSCRVSSFIVLNIFRGIYSPHKGSYGVSFVSFQTEQRCNFIPFMFCLVSCYSRLRYSESTHISEMNISHTGYMKLTANSFILISARCNLWKFYLRMFHHSKPGFSMGPALSSLATPWSVLIYSLRCLRGR